MHRLTIQYDLPADAEFFDEEYFARHVPMCGSVPGLQAASFSKPTAMGSGTSPYLVAELDFNDEQALRAALATPEMAALARHAETLPASRTTFIGEVTTGRVAT